MEAVTVMISRETQDKVLDSLIEGYLQDGVPPPARWVARHAEVSPSTVMAALRLLWERGKVRRSTTRRGVYVPVGCRVEDRRER